MPTRFCSLIYTVSESYYPVEYYVLQKKSPPKFLYFFFEEELPKPAVASAELSLVRLFMSSANLLQMLFAGPLIRAPSFLPTTNLRRQKSSYQHHPLATPKNL
jgi:hypothetical protein